MPLKDRDQRKLPRLGIIRLGYKEERKRQDGSTYTFPRQSDCFVLKDAPRLAEWYEAQGITKPRELDVILPFPTLRQNFDAYYSVWANRVQLCKGDGERVLYANPMRVTEDKKGTHVYQEAGPTIVSDGVAQVEFTWGDQTFIEGEIVRCPGSAEAGRYPHCAACKMSAILKITPYHPDLFDFGYYQITTGSWRNYATITGTLEALPPVVFEKHLPFTLRLVQEQTVYTDRDGKRKPVDKWFLHLQPHPDLLRALFERQAQELVGPIPPTPPPQLAAPAVVQAEPDAMPPYAEDPADQEEPEDDLEDIDYPQATVPPPDTLPESEHAAPDTPPAAPSKKKERPYDPETVRLRIAKVAEKKRHRAKPSIVLLGLSRALYAQIWGENTDQVLPHVLDYLVGHKKLEECHGKEVGAMIDWLKDRQESGSGHSVVSEVAKIEANQIAQLVLEQEGQLRFGGI